MKGHTNNPNGRPKGVPNKVTTDLRQWIANFLGRNLKQFQKDWKTIGPKERLLLFERLLKYSLPFQEATVCSRCADLRSKSEEELEAMLQESLRKLNM